MSRFSACQEREEVSQAKKQAGLLWGGLFPLASTMASPGLFLEARLVSFPGPALRRFSLKPPHQWKGCEEPDGRSWTRSLNLFLPLSPLAEQHEEAEPSAGQKRWFRATNGPVWTAIHRPDGSRDGSRCMGVNEK